MGSTLGATDKLNGGGGVDTVNLDGNYSAGVTFAAATFKNIEVLQLTGGHSYKLTSNDANLAAGDTLTVDGSSLLAGDVLTFNGSFETNGHFIFKSGLGADKLTGGAAADRFDYSAAAQSTGTHYDTVGGFDFDLDQFNVPGQISGIDATVIGGNLSIGNFDNNLDAALAGHLSAHHAILFKPDAGNLSGRTFLIVDLNGGSGYDAGADLVIQLTGAKHVGHLDAGDFI